MHTCTPGKPIDIYWMVFLCSKYNHLKLVSMSFIFVNEGHVVKTLYSKSLQKAFKALSLPTFRITNEGECESPWNSPGQNTRVSSLFLLQGIVPTQGSNLGLLHCGRILYQLSHSSVQFSRSVLSYSFRPHELQHARPPYPSPTPGVHPNSCASSR